MIFIEVLSTVMDCCKPDITKRAPSNPVHQLQNIGVNPRVCTTRLSCLHIHCSSKSIIILWKEFIIDRAIWRHRTILFTSHFCNLFRRTPCTLWCQLACLRGNRVKIKAQHNYIGHTMRNWSLVWVKDWRRDLQ